MYYPYYYYDVRTELTAVLVGDLVKAINGEYSAITCYERLANLAPNEEAKNRILEIRNDEIRHFRVFSQIYTSLTGKQPAPQLTEACPTDYLMGLKASLIDEQETTDFYREIADRATDPKVKEQFRRAAGDEQNHAVWFLYFYTQLCCEKK